MRAITPALLAGLLASLVMPTPALAASCHGHDLLDQIRASAPDYIADIERRGNAMPHGHGRLFRLTREGVEPSYILGTVHSADPRITTLSPAVTGAFSRARSAAFELDKDVGTGNPFADMPPEQVRQLLVAPPDQQVEKLLSPEALKKLELAALDHNLQPQVVWVMRPAILALMMSIPACAVQADKDGGVLDARLLRMARSQNKQVTGLETLAEQLGSVDELPAADQAKLIVSTVGLLDETENLLETAIAMYLKGDIGELLAWARTPKPIPTIDAEIPASFYEALVVRRNVRLAKRALPLLQGGGAFIAVGAAHLPGEDGLLRAFETAGYAVAMVE